MRRILSYWWLLLLIVSLGWFEISSFYDAVEIHELVLPSTQATRDVRTIQTALALYRWDHGRYPTAEEGLEALVGKHIARLPQDPWDSRYAYAVTSPAGGIVYSVGQNRADEHGAGDDITAKRDPRICDEYDNHCERHLSAYLLLAVAVAVGIVRVVLWLHRAALKILARLRG